MVANGLDNLRNEYIVLYDPAYEEKIESRLREEYLESSLLGKGGVIIKSLGHAAAKRYRYAKARYQVGMYEAVGINHKESEDALTIPMFSVATKVVLGSLAKGYQWTKSLKARSKKISTFAKGTGKADDMTRVGRWMSEDEYAKMIDTGYVQESYSSTTHVANPASYKAYIKYMLNSMFQLHH